VKVLVTGASRGIGAEAVRQFREHDWHVLAPSRRVLSFGNINAVNDYLAMQLPEDLDAVVFCHGTWYSQPPIRRTLSEESWLDQYRERVSGPMRLVDNHLAAGENISVVMVSSTRGFIGGVDTGPYAAACAAIESDDNGRVLRVVDGHASSASWV